MRLGKGNIFVLVLMVLSLISTGCNSEQKGPVSTLTDDEFEEELNSPALEFILGPGDNLEISVYRHSDLNKTVRIDPSGIIMYPLAGDVKVAGLTPFQLRDELKQRLSEYIVNPQISINVVSMGSQKIIVLGQVNNPGFFQADALPTALEAIAQAGGFATDSEKKNVLLIRGTLDKPNLMLLDMEKAIAKGDLSHNVALRRGDILYVPATEISDLDRFFSHLSGIISPFIAGETFYLLGDKILEGDTSSVAITSR